MEHSPDLKWKCKIISDGRNDGPDCHIGQDLTLDESSHGKINDFMPRLIQDRSWSQLRRLAISKWPEVDRKMTRLLFFHLAPSLSLLSELKIEGDVRCQVDGLSLAAALLKHQHLETLHLGGVKIMNDEELSFADVFSEGCVVLKTLALDRIIVSRDVLEWDEEVCPRDCKECDYLQTLAFFKHLWLALGTNTTLTAFTHVDDFDVFWDPEAAPSLESSRAFDCMVPMLQKNKHLEYLRIDAVVCLDWKRNWDALWAALEHHPTLVHVDLGNLPYRPYSYKPKTYFAHFFKWLKNAQSLRSVRLEISNFSMQLLEFLEGKTFTPQLIIDQPPALDLSRYPGFLVSVKTRTVANASSLKGVIVFPGDVWS